MLNTAEKEIAMEVCEAMRRRMPKCSKHKWRHKDGEGWGMPVGFCPDSGLCPVGSCPVGLCPVA